MLITPTGFGLELSWSFDRAREALLQCLENRGFKVVCNIGVDALPDAPDTQHEILINWHPALMRRILDQNSDAGVLLPVAVSICRVDPTRVRIMAADIERVRGFARDSNMLRVATDIKSRMAEVLVDLSDQVNTDRLCV